MNGFPKQTEPTYGFPAHGLCLTAAFPGNLLSPGHRPGIRLHPVDERRAGIGIGATTNGRGKSTKHILAVSHIELFAEHAHVLPG